MRTTVELPPVLMRAAKARSAEAGESLKALLERAVAAELGRPVVKAAAAAVRVALPIFGRPADPRANPSTADLERALADVDAARAGGPSRPASRRRPR